MINQDEKIMEGPKAPKDPVERRSGFYVLLDTAIEGTERNEGKPSQEVYLANGQLKDKAKFNGCVTDEEILNLLYNCEGFHKLVHSIGITVRSDKENYGDINFVMQNWGKVDMYNTGTMIRIPCKSDGTETIIKVDEYQWSEQDDVPGKFAFEFNNVADMATASVKFYLNDGYTVPEITSEAPVEFNTQAYKEMISKSLMNLGNTKRLKAAIEKAERGEQVTIAYIGGSITQGAGAKPINTNSYSYQSYLKFKEMFAKGRDNVNFVKVGVGGTPSELGMIRYERDILRDGTVKPDIVIVEFAVNDAGDETKGVCYESLALKILSADNKPAVILLFSVFLDDYNLQERLAPVGNHYNLPMVSVKDAVVEQFRLTKEKGNIISKRQYFYDIYHPTNSGHTVMADCLAYLFSETKKAEVDVDDIIIEKEPVIGNWFTNVHLLDKKDNRDLVKIEEGSFTETDTELQMVEVDVNPFGSPEFPYNWMHTASTGNESFKMTIKSKSLLLIAKDSGNTEFGKADIFVDDKLFITFDPHISNWTHCNPFILYREDECREHKIEIKMASGDEDKCCTILGFGYTL